MSKTTIEEYKNAIWGAYENLKKNDPSSFFSNLTPATVRDYYSYLVRQGLSRADEEIMRLFFMVSETESLLKVIDRTPIDKFKPIIYFLTGKTKNPDQIIRIELAAILISFADRPHQKFSKKETEVPELPHATTLPSFSEDPITAPQSLAAVECPTTTPAPLPLLTPTKRSLATAGFAYKKPLLIGLGVVMLGLLTYVFKRLTHETCLTWEKDRYVEVDCTSDRQGVATFSSTVPYDAALLKVKKVTPTDTTTYFKNGKAVLWYCKIDSSTIELFTAPGYHPVYNKPLRPITYYMIKKYVLHKRP